MNNTERMKWTWFDTSQESREEWSSLCPPDEYRVIKPDCLPDIIPKPLKDKYHSAVVTGTECNDGTTYYMVNGNRVDRKGTAIDQQPFCIAFVGSNAQEKGCLIHHGSWNNRTTKPPEEFWTSWEGSNIGEWYPIPELPVKSAGSIDDLRISSHIDAFRAVISIIRKEFSDD